MLVAVVAVAAVGCGAAAVALSQGGVAAAPAAAGRSSKPPPPPVKPTSPLPKTAPRDLAPGYACAVASGGASPCSLHPCTIYVAPTSSTALPAVTVTAAPTDRCSKAANAPARQIPIGTH